MKHLFRLLLVVLLLSGPAGYAQQSLYFPPNPPGTWATTPPQSLGWCQPQLDSLLSFLGRKGTKAFVVLKDGRLVVERYYGTFTEDSVWYWASAGKALTAALVGQAQHEGLLREQDSVSRWLGRGWSGAPAAQERQITLRHLLAMTSGLDDTPPAPCDNESSTVACLLYHSLAGTRWAYHTGAYRQLQTALTRASGLTLNQYTNQKLASRIGMSGRWVQEVYYSRARDMARFGLLMLARGTWNGTAVLPDTAYLRRMTRPSQAFNRSYGYLWWLNGQASYLLPGPQQAVFSGPLVPTAPADMVAALGKNDQKIYVVPSRGLVVVRQGKSADSPRLAASSFDTELWRYLTAAMQCRTLAAAPGATRAAARLYPNPAAEVVTGSVVPGATRLRVLDVLGRERLTVSAGSSEPTRFSVAALPAGWYAVQWLTSDGQVLASRRLLR
ncbi:serine hydrolase [Hymenobacter weizhouensis]|uniref:serine hydrolase n=1 Tax=Hymenobacter sp. YIM 151500-1 TaxID=2987689 RepID=UPI0022261B40|nr:serine hydrolase [Hymenobacter sp. YIM 151500-1]UYZ61582.1 serine hydrolase [Hymenobacter sp. YIM 151500-1]